MIHWKQVHPLTSVRRLQDSLWRNVKTRRRGFMKLKHFELQPGDCCGHVLFLWTLYLPGLVLVTSLCSEREGNVICVALFIRHTRERDRSLRAGGGELRLRQFPLGWTDRNTTAPTLPPTTDQPLTLTWCLPSSTDQAPSPVSWSSSVGCSVGFVSNTRNSDPTQV